MKIFLAAPFKNKIKNGELEKEYIELLLLIKRTLESFDSSVHLAIEREKWGKEFWSDEACTNKDYEEIKSSDIVVALFDETFSGGIHIELGWASSMGKKICVLKKKEEILCSLIKGLNSVTPCSILEFKDHNEMINKLKDQITKWKD